MMNDLKKTPTIKPASIEKESLSVVESNEVRSSEEESGGEETHGLMRANKSSGYDEEEFVKFTIDLNTLKADMKRKSAKLVSKLSVNSSTCSMLKQFVNELNVVERSVAESDEKVKCAAIESHNIDHSLSSPTSSNSTQIDLDSIDVKCFGKVQLRCESKNKEFSSKIDELRSRLTAARTASCSVLEKIAIEPKILSLPLKKKDMTVLGEWSTRSIEGKSVEESGQDTKKVSKTLSSSSSNSMSMRNTDWSFNFSLDDDSTPNKFGPGPAVLLQALTLSNAGDGFDLERLETVGDSFLKQAITVYLFFTYPHVNEGKLSFLRSKQVSNYNLYKLGKRKGLQELIVSSKFEPLESWLPPHYCSSSTLYPTGFLFASSSSQQTSSSSGSTTTTASTRFDKYRDHCISDKAIADCVEAIIGAYLITSGPHAALQVMSWFGLEVLPRVRCDDDNKTSHQVLVPLPSIQQPPSITDETKLSELMVGFDQFEATIGYKFRHPIYLVQAFTHASYTNNTITDCYQRLEFLGDAILDYVITRYLFECRQYRLSPGELTDLRSSLVNNNIFAYLAVKFDFYKYFKYTSPQIFSIVDSFVQNQKRRCDEFDLEEDVDLIDFPIDDDDEEDYLSMDVDQSTNTNSNTNNNSQPFFFMPTQPNELEELEVPKCLGDIFESVAGAIYLDSNRSLDTVWRIYYGLMKPYIEKFTSKVPKSPIRELLEMEPETVKFEKPERTIDGKIRVTVTVFGKGKFKGVGRNYRIAKNAAAKMALKFLKNQNQD